MSTLTDLSSKVRERFERDTAEHELTVLHDHGLYRHLRFQKPGTSVYYYDLITWPGYLTIAGDAGHYAFSRIPDMFEFFASDHGHINPGYWSEKLCAPSHDGSNVRRYDYETYLVYVKEWFESVSEGLTNEESADLRAALNVDVLSEDSPAVYDEHEAHRMLRDFEHGQLHIEDSWEWDLREFSEIFLWCCWAIVNGVERYRALTANSEDAVAVAVALSA
jgi:hypothetical protein